MVGDVIKVECFLALFNYRRVVGHSLLPKHGFSFSLSMLNHACVTQQGVWTPRWQTTPQNMSSKILIEVPYAVQGSKISKARKGKGIIEREWWGLNCC